LRFRGKMEGLEGLYKEIIRIRSEKFLGYFNVSELTLLEDMLNLDLGVKSRERRGKKPRRRRPFIGWMEGNVLNLCFLTSESNGNLIDLTKCKRRDKRCEWIREKAYLLWDYRRRAFVKYLFKDPELGYILCGRCESLDFLEKLETVTVCQ